MEQEKSIETDSGSSLSTKITMIVFWGLAIIGMCFASILLHYIQDETIEHHTSIADSIAYYVGALKPTKDLSSVQMKTELEVIIQKYDNIKIELYQANKLINYAENKFYTVQPVVFTRSVSIDKKNNIPFELNIILPSVEETIYDKRKKLLLGLGVLILAFGVVLKIVLERIINLPMSRMVGTAQLILDESSENKFDEQRDDEFGYLARFINQAIEQMRESKLESIRAKEIAEVTLESIGDGVVTTDKYGKIIFMNPVAEELSGYKSDYAKSKPLSEVLKIIDEENGGDIEHPIISCLEDNKSIEIDGNSALICNDKSVIPVVTSVAPITDTRGSIHGAVMVFHDMSEARLLQRELTYQASHDHLTGLYNRREFDRELKKALFLCKRDKQAHTLCYLDLDQFKVINDTCGHAAGDVFLKELAEHIQGSLRRSDIFARLGGDEFALLLLHCTISQATGIAENMRKLISEFRFSWEEKFFQVGVSIGVSPLSDAINGAAEVLATADLACYMAKEEGRNRVYVYQEDDESTQSRRKEMSMVSAVRQALEEDRFELFAQPITSTSNKSKWQHFEILLRMRDEEGACIAPSRFLPAAERYQLMPSIDRWVVHNAIIFMAEKNKNKEYSLAINLSGQSINDKDFLKFIVDEISEYGVDASRICFEITETAAVNNISHATSFINELKKLNCKFSLDDFGTGVSSFEYLKRLPVDYLKIDGAFVSHMDSEKIDKAMIKAINEIAVVMGMKTIAEFVENETIFNLLKEIGVDFAQGYWISEPKPIDEIISI